MSLSVLHVIPTLDPLAGGTTAALAGMAGAQADAGLDVHVVSTYPETDTDTFGPQLTQRGVKVTLIGPANNSLRRHPNLGPTLRRKISQADLVHVHAVWEEPQHLALKLGSALGKPVILSPHGMLDRWSLAQSRLKKQLYLAWRLRRNLRRVTALHYTTDEERESVGRFGLPGEALVIPLGLDLHEFCLLYTSPSPRDLSTSRMPSSA